MQTVPSRPVELILRGGRPTALAQATNANHVVTVEQARGDAIESVG